MEGISDGVWSVTNPRDSAGRHPMDSVIDCGLMHF